MKIKQTVLVLACLVVTGFTTVTLVPSSALADCGEVKTSIIGGDICKGVDNKSPDITNNAIWHILLLVLNIMTAGVGILAVGGIVYGSILYASAADRADQTKKAISVITNVVIGIVAYALMYLVLNFLIPGGIFS